MAWDEAYLRVKFHLDPPNRLATIHQQADRQDNAHPKKKAETVKRRMCMRLYRPVCRCVELTRLLCKYVGAENRRVTSRPHYVHVH